MAEERGRVAILPEIDAKLHQSAPPARRKSSALRRYGADAGVQPQYESAAQMVPVLRPLIPANNTITAYQNNNSLVITDYASNLRASKNHRAIDQPSGSDPVMIPLQYASALDVAQTINRLFAESAAGQASPDPSLRFVVTVDARSNSVLARSGEPTRLARVRQLVAMLDSPTSAAGNIHVIYLKNAEAVKLAEILRAIYTGEAARGEGARYAAGRDAGGQRKRRRRAAQACLDTGHHQADAATTAHAVITAPDAIYNNLRAALERLDVRRAQVYVEGLIAEVTADKVAEFGVQWQDLTAAGKSTAQAFGGTNFGGAGQNIIGISQNPATVGQGLNIGIKGYGHDSGHRHADIEHRSSGARAADGHESKHSVHTDAADPR
jgi:general secretion pathway protein D